MQKISGSNIRIECKGLSQEEFFDLCEKFRKLSLKPRVRNPDPLQWGLKIVHELMITVEFYAIDGGATIVAKDVYAWIKNIIANQLEMKHKELAERTKIVPLYGPDGEVVVKVTRLLKKVKTK